MSRQWLSHTVHTQACTSLSYLQGLKSLHCIKSEDNSKPFIEDGKAQVEKFTFKITVCSQ